MHRLTRFRLGCAVAAFVSGMSLGKAQFSTYGSFLDGTKTDPVSVVSELDSDVPTLLPLTEEFHGQRSTSSPPASAKPTGDTTGQTTHAMAAESRDGLVRRQGYMALHRTRIHPQPDIRHATDRYEAIDLSASTREALIRQALERPLPETIHFEESSLRSVLEHLADLGDIPIVTDLQALTDAGIDLDSTTVTQRLPALSLRSAMRLLLREPGLTYLIRDEVLLITTKEKAQENLVVRIYPVPYQITSRGLVELIEGTVVSNTWDTVGGPGGIKASPEANALVISQTQEAHEEITDLLRSLLDGDLGPEQAQADPQAIPTRFYAFRDGRLLQELGPKLVSLCNAALGTAGDPEAKVTVIGGTVAVQSRKRGFHAYAAEAIRAINGVDVAKREYYGVAGSALANGLDTTSGMGVGGGGGMGVFCWVAREVYGPHDPRWLEFRAWMLNEASPWLRSLYAAHGEPFARWLRSRPAAKLVIRHLMDAVLAVESRRPSGT